MDAGVRKMDNNTEQEYTYSPSELLELLEDFQESGMPAGEYLEYLGYTLVKRD